ncbi:hypothetical protein PAPYR_898 [Paratrimastix pyriformis]|uniref:Uncharacterized protein n=1 Tax=Paratrimastix pyriformis TaxID=342808 RepID=A0ABQ8UUR7_9EUKA|nr:hypothetical protein PAPYR_898 [Paratrimastix pyriformis]
MSSAAERELLTFIEDSFAKGPSVSLSYVAFGQHNSLAPEDRAAILSSFVSRLRSECKAKRKILFLDHPSLFLNVEDLRNSIVGFLGLPADQAPGSAKIFSVLPPLGEELVLMIDTGGVVLPNFADHLAGVTRGGLAVVLFHASGTEARATATVGHTQTGIPVAVRRFVWRFDPLQRYDRLIPALYGISPGWLDGAAALVDQLVAAGSLSSPALSLPNPPTGAPEAAAGSPAVQTASPAPMAPTAPTAPTAPAASAASPAPTAPSETAPAPVPTAPLPARPAVPVPLLDAQGLAALGRLFACTQSLARIQQALDVSRQLHFEGPLAHLAGLSPAQFGEAVRSPGHGPQLRMLLARLPSVARCYQGSAWADHPSAEVPLAAAFDPSALPPGAPAPPAELLVAWFGELCAWVRRLGPLTECFLMVAQMAPRLAASQPSRRGAHLPPPHGILGAVVSAVLSERPGPEPREYTDLYRGATNALHNIERDEALRVLRCARGLLTQADRSLVGDGAPLGVLFGPQLAAIEAAARDILEPPKAPPGGLRGPERCVATDARGMMAYMRAHDPEAPTPTVGPTLSALPPPAARSFSHTALVRLPGCQLLAAGSLPEVHLSVGRPPSSA